MQVSEEMYKRQYEYEIKSDTEAAAARLTELRNSAARGDLELPKTSRLISRMYSVVQGHLEQEQARVSRGFGAKVKGWLRSLPADVAAVIAIRECISTLTHHDKAVVLQTLAANIGKLWELELRIREAEAVNPLYMRKIHEQVKDNCTTNRQHIRKLYNVAYRRVMKHEIDSQLSQQDAIQLGKFGVAACIEAGLVVSTRTVAARGTLVQFHLSDEVLEFLTNYNDNDVRGIMDKQAGAMLCPPEDWTALHDGGYLTPRRKMISPLMSLQGIRKSERPRLRTEFTAERMPMVFEAGNYMQSQAFRIHEPTLRAMRRLWESGGGVLGVPDKSGPKRPECPVPEYWVKDGAPEEELRAFQEWKRKATAYYEELRTWRGKVRELGGFLKVSAACGDGPVWFPMYLDRRGRWYYRGSPNPQGSDLAKSVLHFAEKKPLGRDGVFWLKVAVANHFGYDKERFVDRARWTEQHWAAIERALDAPEDYPEVWGNDAPWCMFSAAWELRAALASGRPELYTTGIAVHMDATCSGLQHFSALLRDPVGGQYVNLIDEEKCGPKQDIYARVAANAQRAMQADLASNESGLAEMAAWWLKTGITRSMAKKPVMTYVYGATLLGTSSFIREYIENETDEEWPDPTQSYLYAQYAAQKLFQGIAATVPSAEYAMRWLRDVAKEQPSGRRMEWRAPTGFLVQHDYRKSNDKKVFIRSCGLQAVLVRELTDDTAPLQMQNAVAPNFVHALDASHLTLTALKMRDAGLSMVGIHDSFGTHACDVPALHRCTREAFRDIYQNKNILGEFLWDVQSVRDVPMRGTLDISQVLESEFFFC